MAVSPGPGGDQAQGASLGDTLVDSVTMSQTDVDGVVIIGDPGFVKSVDQSLLDLKKLTTSPIRIQSIETKDYKVDQYFKYRLAYTAGMPIFLLTSLTLEKVRNLFYEFFAFSTHEVGDGNEWLSKDTSDAVGVKAKMILCNNHKVSMNSQFFKGFIQWASSMVKQDDSLPFFRLLIAKYGQKQELQMHMALRGLLIDWSLVEISVIHLGWMFKANGDTKPDNTLIALSSKAREGNTSFGSWFCPLGIRGMATCILESNNHIVKELEIIVQELKLKDMEDVTSDQKTKNGSISKMRGYIPELSNCRPHNDHVARTARQLMTARTLIGGGETWSQVPTEL